MEHFNVTRVKICLQSSAGVQKGSSQTLGNYLPKSIEPPSR